MTQYRIYRQKLQMIFAAMTLMLSGAAMAIYFSFGQLDKERAWVNHTYEVIGTLDTILSDLADMQSSQRGYIITGEDDELAPYNLALPRIDNNVRRLENLVADNPLQAQRLKRLKRGIDNRKMQSTEVITTFRNQGQDAAYAKIRRGTGKGQMDEIRAQVSEMVAEETRLLGLRQNSMHRAAGLTVSIGAASFLLCFILFAIAYVIVKRESWRRAETERSLQDVIKRMERISIETQLLSDMSDYMQSASSSNEAYNVISRYIPQLLPLTCGSISIFNNSRNLLETEIFWNGGCGGMPSFSAEDCWALRRGRVHFMQPGGSDPVCNHLRGVGAGGCVCIPMQAHGETIGLLHIQAPEVGNLPDAGSSLVRTIGEQVSMAISSLRLQEKLRQQSIRDPLTQLFNRRYLEETMERELSRSRRHRQPLSVLMIDVDHFKRYNDNFGHDAGDAVLVSFARLLMNKVRKEDIACRYGGEEFTIILPSTPIENARIVAQQLCDATRKMQVSLHGKALSMVTISIGVSCFPLTSDSMGELFQAADAALYKAKHQGRDRVVLADIGHTQEQNPESHLLAAPETEG